ncbi:hypothetical protein [Sphaerisporangium aureirubrum]|uniref:DUF998 domain-containing protein n=1 Tax=Sphaerisporangium aureirubrum TaxID=1544736 RepID=A0ABW1NV15_9ACTN
MSVTRSGAAALAAGGVLFLLYQTVRPYTGETGMRGAATMASSAWVASHTLAMLAFVLVTLGMVAVHGVLRGRVSGTAAVLTGVGAGLVLPYYGGEAFGLHAIAARALRDGDPSLMTLVDDFRYGPVAITMFGAGLVLLGAGAVLAAIAARRSGVLPAWSMIPLAAASVLLIPQFYGPPALRVAHGVLLAAGAAWAAWHLFDARPAARSARLGHDGVRAVVG